jgi:hypothetical protein
MTDLSEEEAVDRRRAVAAAVAVTAFAFGYQCLSNVGFSDNHFVHLGRAQHTLLGGAMISFGVLTAGTTSVGAIGDFGSRPDRWPVSAWRFIIGNVVFWLMVVCQRESPFRLSDHAHCV